MIRLHRRYVLISTGLLGIASIGLGVMFLSTHLAKATESFNPANIMSDGTFTNRNSMSVNQIQNFLESKGSTCLANFTSLSLNDANGDGLGDEPYGKGIGEQVSAATLIWQAAQLYRINPQVILATLQKEQGLVTRTDCPSWRYNTALGYGCPDSQPCDSAAYGFTRQIDYGVWHFRGFFDDTYPVPPTVPGNKFIAYNPNGSCGGTTLNIQNRATAALYSYTPYQPNAAALAAAPGQIVNCGSYGNLNFWRYFTAWFGSTQYEPPIILFKSHLKNTGWTETDVNRGVTGTTGQSKPMEAIRLDGSVEYSSYSFDTGWQPTVIQGMISGTTGLNKPIQAVKINPTGTTNQLYDIYYRTHISNVGWMGWTKNGQPAGVTGDVNKNIEAVEVQLVDKGSPAPGSTNNAYQNINTISYSPSASLSISSHVSEMGWQPNVTDTMVSGTTEQSRQIEAMKIALTNTTGTPGGITYASYLLGIGWQDFKLNNEASGTTGQSRRMEALRIALTGELGNNYDVWYRGYVQNRAWQGWVKNGSPVGSVGAGLRLEAIETRILPKNSSAAPVSSVGLYNPQNVGIPDSYSLSYSTHLSNIGWVSGTRQNDTGGTTGQSRPMEALRFDTINSIFGDIGISCSAYVKNTGWLNDVTPGSICGSTGQSKSIEAIKLKATGTAASKYDIYYRVHLSRVGWQNWVKNDEQTGTPLSNNSIEAIIIKLVQK